MTEHKTFGMPQEFYDGKLVMELYSAHIGTTLDAYTISEEDYLMRWWRGAYVRDGHGCWKVSVYHIDDIHFHRKLFNTPAKIRYHSKVEWYLQNSPQL